MGFLGVSRSSSLEDAASSLPSSVVMGRGSNIPFRDYRRMITWTHY